TLHEESRPYEFGDPVANLNLQETLRNAIARQGGGTPVRIAEEDLVVHDSQYQTTCATVVLVDMSGSLMRYGKCGAAKRVALPLQALLRSPYPGDWLQTGGFYSCASPLSERELPHAAPKPVSIYDTRVHLRNDLDRPPAFVPK